jgi:transcriptional regulator with XRE-family HTH domain
VKNELKQFGFRLKEAREGKKITREDLSDRLNIHFRTLSKWENGQTDPPLGKVLKIADILNEPLHKLLGLEAGQMKDSFNNNQQEGETCILNSGTIAFEKEALSEFNKRFAFLESMIVSLQETNKGLLEILWQPNSITTSASSHK